jgi:hypothetical protein
LAILPVSIESLRPSRSTSNVCIFIYSFRAGLRSPDVLFRRNIGYADEKSAVIAKLDEGN